MYHSKVSKCIPLSECIEMSTKERSLQKQDLSAIVRGLVGLLTEKANLSEPPASLFLHSDAGIQHDCNIRSIKKLWSIKVSLVIK